MTFPSLVLVIAGRTPIGAAISNVVEVYNMTSMTYVKNFTTLIRRAWHNAAVLGPLIYIAGGASPGTTSFTTSVEVIPVIGPNTTWPI